MLQESQAVIRSVENDDRNQLANLIHFGTYVHRHLDWRPPLGWIGYTPFNVLEINNKLTAALACPPDPPKIAWLRVFVCNSQYSYTKAWKTLWPSTKEQLQTMGVEILAAIPLQKWIRELLIKERFEKTHDVISLAWDKQEFLAKDSLSANIREMTQDDLPDVLRIDNLAFDPLWQNSSDLLELAFDSALIATVAYDDFGIIGYQISNPTQYGLHLGRLAVHPASQGKGVGFSIIQHLQSEFSKNNMGRISVNTQSTNNKSLSLYHKAGFEETNESFPVFQYTF